jgi:predicted nucleic acid-binding protein
VNVDRVIDTNFLISRWREGKKSPASAWLLAHPDLSLGIPWIVKAEFLRGAAVAGHDRQEVRAFLTRYPTVWPNEESLEIYADLFAAMRKSNSLIGPHDLWIAVAALQCGVALVSRNSAEFGKVPELQVERY